MIFACTKNWTLNNFDANYNLMKFLKKTQLHNESKVFKKNYEYFIRLFVLMHQSQDIITSSLDLEQKVS